MLGQFWLVEVARLWDSARDEWKIAHHPTASYMFDAKI